MRTAGRGTDVSLLFSGRGVVAHKIILALRCPELQQLVDAADHFERYLEVSSQDIYISSEPKVALYLDLQIPHLTTVRFVGHRSWRVVGMRT